jgi:hypothetical protein
MGPDASSARRSKWRRPQEDKILRRMTLAGFAAALALFLFFTWMDCRRSGAWYSADDICFVGMMMGVLALLFIVYLMFWRLDRLNVATYSYSWMGRFDEIEAKVSRALEMQGLGNEEVTRTRKWPFWSGLLKVDIVVLSVPSMGFRVHMENNREREDDPTDDSCTVRVGPVNDATHAAIFHIIEAFNSLFDEEELPKLVVWGRRTGRPPSTSAGKPGPEGGGA